MRPVASALRLLPLRPLQKLLKQPFLLGRIRGSGARCLCPRQCGIDASRDWRRLGGIVIEPLLCGSEALPAAYRPCHVDVAPGGMTGGFAQLFGLAEKRIDEFLDTPVVVATARPVEGDQNCAGRDGLDLVLLGDQIWIILVGDVRGHIVLLEGRNVWNTE